MLRHRNPCRAAGIQCVHGQGPPPLHGLGADVIEVTGTELEIQLAPAVLFGDIIEPEFNPFVPRIAQVQVILVNVRNSATGVSYEVVPGRSASPAAVRLHWRGMLPEKVLRSAVRRWTACQDNQPLRYRHDRGRA